MTAIQEIDSLTSDGKFDWCKRSLWTAAGYSILLAREVYKTVEVIFLKDRAMSRGLSFIWGMATRRQGWVQLTMDHGRDIGISLARLIAISFASHKLARYCFAQGEAKKKVS